LVLMRLKISPRIRAKGTARAMPFASPRFA
jgi:hypothetical protein